MGAMNREKLQARLAGLQEQMDRAMATAHAISGAMQEVNFWLSQHDPQPQQPDPDSEAAR